MATDRKPSETRGGLAPAQKVELASLVSYQQGAVVSRTLMNNRAGTVTLFAFDEGDGLSEHSAPYDALLHVLEGESEVTIAGTKNRLKGAKRSSSRPETLTPCGRRRSSRCSSR
jgi:hypothetical protein